MLMIKLNQKGEANGLVISLIITVVLLVGALGIAGWAIAGRQDYKNNSDAKVQAAVTKAVKAEDIVKDKQFEEQYKNPLLTYNGPADYGSLNFQYPKTWSGYVDDTGSAARPIDAYFAPPIVPSFSNPASIYALRVQVLNQSYESVLKSYDSLQRTGKVTVSAYALPKMPKTVGVRVVGQLLNKKTIDIVVLPLRAQTVTLWTEGGIYSNDFNTYILPNFSFTP